MNARTRTFPYDSMGLLVHAGARICIHVVRQALLLDRDEVSVAMLDWDATQDDGDVIGNVADVPAVSRTADGGDPRPRGIYCELIRGL